MALSAVILAACIVATVNSLPVSDGMGLFGGGSTFTGHCATLCNGNHEKGLIGAVDQLVGKYTSNNACINDCMCASYCDLFDTLLDIPIEQCVPACRIANPAADPDTFLPKLKGLLAAEVEA